MLLSTGTRLGPYEILSPLGAGGMGEVYRARDTKLGRDVALKILPAAFVTDPDRLARFRREAQVLASLNHPRIGAIYGLDEADRAQFLVLELIDGESLDKRIARGPIPVDSALAIAEQITEALEAAHENGVIHRDLKPANIALTKNGAVKVLDFGLAKATERARDTFLAVTNSPTVMSPTAVSGVGVVLGTAGYMSPEQARGTPVNGRTDIWSFGCVLYEMLTGLRAFPGETVQDTLAKVLEREPNWKALPASTPTKIRRLVQQCLQKDQSLRPNHVAEIRTAIADARTSPYARRRVTVWLIAIASIAVALSVIVGVWWYVRTPGNAVPREAVSVLIADLENRTGEPTFDHTLESVLKLALEGAGFISAYDRTGVRSLGAPAPDQLDERTAMAIAFKQGVGVVVSGTIDRHAKDYVVSIKATEAVTGRVLTNATNRTSGKDQVMVATANLATAVRTALGDRTSNLESFAMDTLSATSLDAVRYYAKGTESLAKTNFEDALQSFSKAVELDPNFGMGYHGMAQASRNLDRPDDAEKYIKEALRHLDRMTERERYRARGFFYRITGDYQACVKEYGDLIARYAADVAAHNQVALCSTYLRNMPRAVDEMRKVVKIVPKSTILRNNLAVYLSYSGDFGAAEQEARAIENPGVNSVIALAFAQLGQDQVNQALETYQKLTTMGTQGASRAVSGSGDLAVYEGRFAEGARILGKGATIDQTAMEPNRAAAKFAALAYAQLLRKENAGAIAAANSALTSSRSVKIRFLAGHTLAEVGDLSQARNVAAGLASELLAEPQAHAKIIDGVILLKRGDARQAIKMLTEANGQLDTWIGHFDLGRAFLEAGEYIRADSEFDRCIKRRGEALSLFLDEEPTYSYLPSVYFYQGRAREGLLTAEFRDSYRKYLSIRGKSSEDPLVQEARRRVDH